MLLALVLAHFLVALALPAVAVRNLRAAFGVAAVLPAAAFGWALAHAPAALAGGVTESVAWAPVLGLAFDVRLDALGLVMVVLVSGLGALILVYSAWYFAPTSGDGRRSAPLLLVFASPPNTVTSSACTAARRFSRRAPSWPTSRNDATDVSSQKT